MNNVNTPVVQETTTTLLVEQDNKVLFDTFDLNSIGLESADYPRVQQRLADIRNSSSINIGSLGQGVASKTADYTTEVLELVKAKDTTTGQKLNEVVKVLSSLNTKNAISKPGFFGKMFGGFKGVKQSFDARYASTKSQINTMMVEISESQIGLKSRVQMMTQMSTHVAAQHKEIGIFIAAGKLKVHEMQLELQELNNGNNETLYGARIFELNTDIHTLEKRIGDLQLLQRSAEQSIHMIRIITGNNLMLINKFDAIKDVTIPAWENQIALAITLEEQASAVEMVAAIDDTTNSLLRSNADLLYSNSVGTAKANQRAVIDVDTIKYVHDKLVSTVKDTIQAHEDGIKERARGEQELKDLNLQMRTFVGSKVDEASHRRLG